MRTPGDDLECVLGAGTFRESVVLRANSGAAKTTIRADAAGGAGAGGAVLPTLSGLEAGPSNRFV
jgi:hypothetical protein